MGHITHRTRKLEPKGAADRRRPIVVKVLTSSGKTVYRHFHHHSEED